MVTLVFNFFVYSPTPFPAEKLNKVVGLDVPVSVRLVRVVILFEVVVNSDDKPVKSPYNAIIEFDVNEYLCSFMFVPQLGFVS